MQNLVASLLATLMLLEEYYVYEEIRLELLLCIVDVNLKNGKKERKMLFEPKRRTPDKKFCLKSSK